MPPPKVIGDRRLISDLNNQSSINAIDKQVLFYPGF